MIFRYEHLDLAAHSGAFTQRVLSIVLASQKCRLPLRLAPLPHLPTPLGLSREIENP